jgi:hypothetical protein
MHQSSISIALLYPQSEIFTRLRADLQHAVNTGVHVAGYRGTVDWHPEFIHGADVRSLEKGFQKAIYHLDCHLAIVVANTHLVHEHAALFTKSRLPVLVLNLGAKIPKAEWANPCLFYNSLHSWKAQWSLGCWAQQQYGGKCAVNTTLYDGGYLLHEAFRLGLGAGGAQTMYLNLVKNFGKMYDTAPLFDQMAQQSFNHAHAVLSGREGKDFLDRYQALPALREKPLTVNAFMVDETVMSPHASMSGVVSATTWIRSDTSEANQVFLEAYRHQYKHVPHAFSLLGYEAGLALGNALHNAPPEDAAAFCAALENSDARGPRGKVELSTLQMQTSAPVHIFRTWVQEAKKSLHYESLGEGTSIAWNDPELVISAQAAVSGWQNPYLCL